MSDLPGACPVPLSEILAVLEPVARWVNEAAANGDAVAKRFQRVAALHARLSQPVADRSAWREYMQSDAAKQEMEAESAEPGPSDTEMLDWMSRYHGCEPMQVWEYGWKWMYMGRHYDHLRDALRAAMRKERP